MNLKSCSGLFILHDDASVREKLTVMSMWEAMMDDARNVEPPYSGADFAEQIEAIMELGKTYRVTIEEVQEAAP